MIQKYLNKITCIDALELLKDLPTNCIDTIITDPPYGLKFCGKKWDYELPSIEIFQEMLRVAKPGTTLMCFGGTRTFHRLTCNIEDAGWEIRDCMMWLYGSGFPKSLDIGKAIDKKMGVESEVIGKADRLSHGFDSYTGSKAGGAQRKLLDVTAPSSPEGQKWEGYGTALKPSYEVIVQFQKPFKEIPFDDKLIVETQHLLGALLCLFLSSASNVQKLSKLSYSVIKKGCVSALMLVGVLRGNELGVLLDMMDTYNSQDQVLMCLNIAILWKDILDVLLVQKNIFTIEMATKVTTTLKILNSLLLTSIPQSVIQDVTQIVGCECSVDSVKTFMINEKGNGKNILKTFAHILASFEQSKNGIDVDTVKKNLQLIIPSVYSALKDVTFLLEKEIALQPKIDYAPIVLAMKPIEDNFATNALKYGVTGLNIDEGRIPFETEDRKAYEKKRNSFKNTEGHIAPNIFAKPAGNIEDAIKNSEKGRWPSNLVLDTEAAKLLDEQSGFLHPGGNKNETLCGKGLFRENNKLQTIQDYDKGGGASRFFYTAKPSQAERNVGCEELSSKAKVFNGQSTENSGNAKGSVEDKFSTNPQGNYHPTVKPLKLIEYLCKLTKTPTGGIVLDPFAGSGTTALACRNTARDYICCDLDLDYCKIGRKRLGYGPLFS